VSCFLQGNLDNIKLNYDIVGAKLGQFARKKSKLDRPVGAGTSSDINI